MWIGNPDTPGTTVIYLLSKPYPCSATAWAKASGWDTKVPAGTLMLEFKLAAPPPTIFPTMYTVITTNPALPAPPTAGNGFAFWNSFTSTPAIGETSASGSNVTVTAMNANTNVTGTFNLMFGANPLTGSFDAKYCAPAGEP